MSLNWVMDKQNMIHSRSRMLLSNKRNELQIYATTWLNLKYTIPSERRQRPYPVWFHLMKLMIHDNLAKVKLQGRITNQWLPGAGVGRGVDCKGVKMNFLGWCNCFTWLFIPRGDYTALYTFQNLKNCTIKRLKIYFNLLLSRLRFNLLKS